MINSKWKILGFLLMLFVCLSCNRNQQQITTKPVPFSPPTLYGLGIETPEISWQYQWETSVESNATIPVQTDGENNLFFVTRNGEFCSLNSKGELRWKKANGLEPLLIAADKKSFLTLRNNHVRHFDSDGLMNKIWDEYGTPFIGPDGYVYSLLNSSNKSTLFCLDSLGEVRWKLTYAVKEHKKDTIDGVWFDKQNNIYVCVHLQYEDTEESVLYSFFTNGTPRWMKRFPENTIVQTVKSGQVFDQFMLFSVTSSLSDPATPAPPWLIALDQDGKELWRKKEYRNGRFSSPLVVCPNGNIALPFLSETDQATYLKSYNHTGEEMWERKLISNEVSPVVSDRESHIYITTGGKQGDRYLYAFYPDGTTKWKIKVPTPLSTKADNLYLGHDKSIYLTLLNKGVIYRITQKVP